MSFEVLAVHSATSLTLLDLQTNEMIEIHANARIEVPRLFVPGSSVCEPFALEARDAVRKNFLGRPVEAEQLSNSIFCIVTRSDGESVPSCLLKRGLAKLHPSVLKSTSKLDAPLIAAQEEAQRQRIGVWSAEHRPAEAQAVPCYPLLRDEIQREMLALELQRRWVRVSVEQAHSGGGGSAVNWFFDAVIVSSAQEIRFQIAGILSPLSQRVEKAGKLHLVRRMLHRVVDIKIVGYDRASMAFFAAFRDERVERLVASGLAHIDRRTLHMSRSPQGLLVASAAAMKERKGFYDESAASSPARKSSRGAAASASSSSSSSLSPDLEMAFSLERHDFVARVVDVQSESSILVEFVRFYALYNVQAELVMAAQQEQQQQQQKKDGYEASSSDSGARAESTSSSNNNNSPSPSSKKTVLETMMVTTSSVAGEELTTTASATSAFQLRGTSATAALLPTQQELNEFIAEKKIADKLFSRRIVVNLAFLHDPAGAQLDQQKDKFVVSRAALAARQFLREVLIGQAVLVRPFVADSSSSITTTTTLFADVLLRQPRIVQSEIVAGDDAKNDDDGNDDDDNDAQHKSTATTTTQLMETSTIAEAMVSAHVAPHRALLPIPISESNSVPPPESLVHLLSSAVHSKKQKNDDDDPFAANMAITRLSANLSSHSAVQNLLSSSSSTRVVVENMTASTSSSSKQLQLELLFIDFGLQLPATLAFVDLSSSSNGNGNNAFVAETLVEKLRYRPFVCDVVSVGASAVEVVLHVPAQERQMQEEEERQQQMAAAMGGEQQQQYEDAEEAEQKKKEEEVVASVVEEEEEDEIVVVHSSSSSITQARGSLSDHVPPPPPSLPLSLLMEQFPTFNHALLALGLAPLSSSLPPSSSSIPVPLTASIADAFLSAVIQERGIWGEKKKKEKKNSTTTTKKQMDLLQKSGSFLAIALDVSGDGLVLLRDPQADRVQEALATVESMRLGKWAHLTPGETVLVFCPDLGIGSAVDGPVQRGVVEQLLFDDPQPPAAAAAVSAEVDGGAKQQRRGRRGGRSAAKINQKDDDAGTAKIDHPAAAAAPSSKQQQQQQPLRPCGCSVTLIDAVGAPRFDFASLGDIRVLPKLPEMEAEVDPANVPRIQTVIRAPPLLQVCFLAFFVPEAWSAAATDSLRQMLFAESQGAPRPVRVLPLYDHIDSSSGSSSMLCVLLHPISGIDENDGSFDLARAMKLQHTLREHGTVALNLEAVSRSPKLWSL